MHDDPALGRARIPARQITADGEDRFRDARHFGDQEWSPSRRTGSH